MAILESCCFWKDVRSGSFACAIYTLKFFSFYVLIRNSFKRCLSKTPKINWRTKKIN
ncbi:uncharacterized protein Dana_GF28035 [Drosophila ananassae]|uniref:Uncharacterized protein n=1 Tax=Drosophila ananassae TaxID=7217 RepID=A0A0P8XUV6_DROAN|nr:uncharacterized protein Dana_GF28035 [Drosophila ananassae]